MRDDPGMGLTWEALEPLLKEMCDVVAKTKEDIVNLTIHTGDGSDEETNARLVFAIGTRAVKAMDHAVLMIDAARGRGQTGPDDIEEVQGE